MAAKLMSEHLKWNILSGEWERKRENQKGGENR